MKTTTFVAEGIGFYPYPQFGAFYGRAGGTHFAVAMLVDESPERWDDGTPNLYEIDRDFLGQLPYIPTLED